MTSDPHRNQPIRRTGAALATAKAAMILLHGRGASAEDILGLAGEMYDERVVYLAPQAAGHTWYPNSFLAPISQNQPWLSSALAKVAETIQYAVDAGLTHDRIVVCGFSQGACLASEFVARNPTRYGAVVVFTGGLIGPPDIDLHHPGRLAGTPTLFSSGDPDPHVPWTRVAASAKQFTAMGAEVQLQRHEGRPHTVSAPELESARKLLMELF
jgi:phospholipase/carboxylesterase